MCFIVSCQIRKHLASAAAAVIFFVFVVRVPYIGTLLGCETVMLGAYGSRC